MRKISTNAKCLLTKTYVIMAFVSTRLEDFNVFADLGLLVIFVTVILMSVFGIIAKRIDHGMAVDLSCEAGGEDKMEAKHGCPSRIICE